MSGIYGYTAKQPVPTTEYLQFLSKWNRFYGREGFGELELSDSGIIGGVMPTILYETGGFYSGGIALRCGETNV